jgi:hypothetical protein
MKNVNHLADEMKSELQAMAIDALEDIPGTHFMFKDDCPPMLRSAIRERQAIASEILKSRTLVPIPAQKWNKCH